MAEAPVLLLAAGSSARMREPKQLLPWGDTTLIEHQIITLVKTGNPVFVVLGARSNLIIPVIEKYEINIIVNENWKEGMGTSISYGINQIIKTLPGANSVLIALLDQPLITTTYFQKMFECYTPENRQILVSLSDSGWIGVPALFDKYYFKHLLKLNNDEGAKKIINRFKDNVSIIKCNDPLEDIDTPLAYQQLLSKYSSQSTL